MLRRDIETLIEKIARLKVQSSELRVESSELRVQSSELRVESSELRVESSEFRKSQIPNPKSQIPNPKLKDLALTTNGFSIPAKAQRLKELGLDRLTISLDSLDREKFKEITGKDELDNVFKSITAAKEAGLTPIKINAVIVRGRNEDELVDFARFAREWDVSMRFIEFMPLDSGHEWKKEMVVSGREIRATIEKEFSLELKSKNRGMATAWNYKFADTESGEIGIIAPVTEMFCGACSRIRLTADGQIRTCLFSAEEYNLRDVLRSGASREEIVGFIRQVVLKKEASHQINDSDFIQPTRTMSFIGG
jgi:cyclic pyranopterin phosphate synthase